MIGAFPRGRAGLFLLLGTSVALTVGGALWLRSVSSLEARMGNVCNDLATETDLPYLVIGLGFVPLLLITVQLAVRGRPDSADLGATLCLFLLTIIAGIAALCAAPLGGFLFLYLLFGAIVILPLMLYALIHGVQMLAGQRATFLTVLAFDVALPGLVFTVSLHPILSC